MWFCFGKQEIRNTIGNIPLEWYDDYPHLGYDIDGKSQPKPVTVDEVGVAMQYILRHQNDVVVYLTAWGVSS